MQWISVEDKYPEEGIPVLVYAPEHGHYVAGWDGDWEDAETGRYLGDIGITHWAELTCPE